MKWQLHVWLIRIVHVLVLGGSEQKKKGGTQRRFTPYCQVCLSTTVQMAIKFAAHFFFWLFWLHLRVLVASAWGKLIDGHSQVANPVFFSLGVCENNSSLFFLSLAKLCRLKFTFRNKKNDKDVDDFELHWLMTFTTVERTPPHAWLTKRRSFLLGSSWIT